MTAVPYPPIDRSAPCRKGNPERWFPASGANGTTLEEVKAECRGCPFRDPCLTWAMAREQFGVWGGTTADERARARKSEGIRLESPPHMLLLPDRSVTYRRRPA